MTSDSRVERIFFNLLRLGLCAFLVIVIGIWVTAFAPIVFFASFDFTEYMKTAEPECTADGFHYPLATAFMALGMYMLWLATGLMLGVLAFLNSSKLRFKWLVFIGLAGLVSAIVFYAPIIRPVLILMIPPMGCTYLFLELLDFRAHLFLRFLGFRAEQLVCAGIVCLILTLITIPRWWSLMELSAKLDQYCADVTNVL